MLIPGLRKTERVPNAKTWLFLQSVTKPQVDFEGRKREDLRDDLRKLGLVWIGAGLITFVVQGNWIGIIPFLVGSILLFFGLTQPTESQTFEDHNNE